MTNQKVFGKINSTQIETNKEKNEIIEQKPEKIWYDEKTIMDEIMRKKRMTEKERKAVNFMPKRGDIWMVDFGSNVGSEIAKARPAIIVSSARYNETSSLITVIPVSKSARPMRTHVEISENTTSEGVVEGFGKAEQIRTVSKGRFGEKIGRLNGKGLDIMTDCLRCHLSIMKSDYEKAMPLENELEQN